MRNHTPKYLYGASEKCYYHVPVFFISQSLRSFELRILLTENYNNDVVITIFLIYNNNDGKNK